MILSEAYNYGVYFLSANGIDEADFKSLCLCCHCAGIKNNEYEIHKNDDLIIMKKFADMLWQVKSGEPLQYVIGKWDFYEFVPQTLVVRYSMINKNPETHIVVQDGGQ